jgi:hypothetical protein
MEQTHPPTLRVSKSNTQQVTEPKDRQANGSNPNNRGEREADKKSSESSALPRLDIESEPSAIKKNFHNNSESKTSTMPNNKKQSFRSATL